jgi:3-oxoacyl-[acyl-carrier-protein] synthase-1
VQIDWRDHNFEKFTVAGVPEDGLPELVKTLEEETSLTYRESRMLRLGTSPLRECMKPLASTGKSAGLVLSLPQTSTTKSIDESKFLRNFAQQTQNGFDIKQSLTVRKGRAGGLLAIGQAYQRICEGKAQFVVAGGIDTYCDLYILASLDHEKRVKSPEHLDGFIPGEGAAFVLLADREIAKKAGLTPLALLSPPATGFEEGHLYSKEPYRGDGLAAVFEKLFQGNAFKGTVQEVYSSMNGENHWAKEWGVAFLRCRAKFGPDYRIHHPADCLGDTGAACGALLVALASLGIRQGYRRSPCLAYSSSDHGERAAMAVSSL